MKRPLGLHLPKVGEIKLRFATYANYRTLPTPPATFGHMNIVPTWGVLGNLQYGDCALAGPGHQIMYWTTETGKLAPFNQACTLANYHGVDPDFDPNNKATDAGVNLDDMAKYWRRTGMVDANGNRHKIVAYADLNPGDLRELWTAAWLFQGVQAAFALPDTAQDQTDNNQIWSVVPGYQILGGHCVPIFNCAASTFVYGIGVTWGLPQSFTGQFYETFNQGGIVAFSRDMITKAKSIDGFDADMLLDDVQQVTAL